MLSGGYDVLFIWGAKPFRLRHHRKSNSVLLFTRPHTCISDKGYVCDKYWALAILDDKGPYE